MTVAWTNFGAPVDFTDSDQLVGLAGGTANKRFNAASILISANNLGDLQDPVAAQTNLELRLLPGAGTGALKGSSSCTADGDYAFSFGNTCFATGNYSIALGESCQALGVHSIALGSTAVATNDGSVVWGDNATTANPDTAVNQFNLTFANGYRFFGGAFNVSTVGKGLQVKEGSNAKQGVVTLVSGVGVVANTSVTANSRIFYCGQDTNVTGFLKITARSNGSGFTITSSVLSDTGVVAYEIFEPAV